MALAAYLWKLIFLLIWKRKKTRSTRKEIHGFLRSREVRKCTQKEKKKKRINPSKSKKPAPKVIVDDVDFEQQNQN